MSDRKYFEDNRQAIKLETVYDPSVTLCLLFVFPLSALIGL